MGRELGLSPKQVREIIKEQRELIRREALMQEPLACDNLEDVKIILLDWIDKGYVK
jgi:hypothetical protein